MCLCCEGLGCREEGDSLLNSRGTEPLKLVSAFRRSRGMYNDIIEQETSKVPKPCSPNKKSKKLKGTISRSAGVGVQSVEAGL